MSTSPTTTTSSNDDDELAPEVIAGYVILAIGAVGVIIAIILICYICCMRRRKQKKRREMEKQRNSQRLYVEYVKPPETPRDGPMITATHASKVHAMTANNNNRKVTDSNTLSNGQVASLGNIGPQKSIRPMMSSNMREGYSVRKAKSSDNLDGVIVSAPNLNRTSATVTRPLVAQRGLAKSESGLNTKQQVYVQREVLVQNTKGEQFLLPVSHPAVQNSLKGNTLRTHSVSTLYSKKSKKGFGKRKRYKSHSGLAGPYYIQTGNPNRYQMSKSVDDLRIRKKAPSVAHSSPGGVIPVYLPVKSGAHTTGRMKYAPRAASDVYDGRIAKVPPPHLRQYHAEREMASQRVNTWLMKRSHSDENLRELRKYKHTNEEPLEALDPNALHLKWHPYLSNENLADIAEGSGRQVTHQQGQPISLTIKTEGNL